MSLDEMYLFAFTFGLLAFIGLVTAFFMGVVKLLEWRGLIVFEEPINVDFYQRLQDGEVLSADNMFSNE